MNFTRGGAPLQAELIYHENPFEIEANREAP
jgi:hypothetical protein